MKVTVSPMNGNDCDAIALLAGQLGYPSTSEQVRSRFSLIASNPMQIFSKNVE